MDRPPEPRTRTFLGFTASKQPGLGVYCRQAWSLSFTVILATSTLNISHSTHHTRHCPVQPGTSCPQSSTNNSSTHQNSQHITTTLLTKLPNTCNKTLTPDCQICTVWLGPWKRQITFPSLSGRPCAPGETVRWTNATDETYSTLPATLSQYTSQSRY